LVIYKDCNKMDGQQNIKKLRNILIVNCITNSCICNTCVTWQDIDYKLPEDDTIVSKLCEIIVHLLVIT